jgi:hypothetical protein
MGARQMKRPEDDAQMSVIRHVLKPLEAVNALTFCAIPNQLARTVKIRRIFSALGLRAGAPDLMIFLPGGKLLQVELKVTNRPHTDNQQAWQNRTERLGFTYVLLRIIDEIDAQKQLIALLIHHGVKII